MNIDYNKIHGGHDIHDQVQSFHDSVYRVVGRLPIADHHRSLAHRTSGNPIFKLIDHKGNALIHQSVQIGRVTGHLCHHTNLKKKKKTRQKRSLIICSILSHKKLSPTHRHPVIETTVAVVTLGSSLDMQAEHHLIPIMELAQTCRVPHDAAFRQFFKLFQHLLPLVHGVKTVHPKHDFHLDLQGEHITKRSVVRID